MRRNNMANREHLDLLKHSIENWHGWRKQHPEILPDLSEANLSTANLTGADLSRATLVSTNCTKAILTDCRIYGISAWDVELQGATQNSLIIAGHEQPLISVDNLKIAQFIYLLLNNQEIR